MQAWQDALAALQAEVSSKPELLARLQLLGDAAAARSKLDNELRQVISAKDAEAARLRGEVNRMRHALQQSSNHSEDTATQIKTLEHELQHAQRRDRQASRAAVLQAAEAAVNTPQGEIIALRAQLQAQSEANNRLESELAAAVAGSRARLSELQDSYTAKVADMRRLHAEALAAAEARVSATHSARTQSALDAAQAELTSVKQQLHESQEQARALLNKLTAAEASLAASTNEVVQQQQAVRDAQQAQQAAAARAAAAEDDANAMRAQVMQAQANAASSGPTVTEMQGMLQLMEGQLVRLSELVRARDGELAELRKVLQAGFEERQELTKKLEAAAATGSAAAVRTASAAPASLSSPSPSSPTGSLHGAGRLGSSPNKPYSDLSTLPHPSQPDTNRITAGAPQRGTAKQSCRFNMWAVRSLPQAQSSSCKRPCTAVRSMASPQHLISNVQQYPAKLKELLAAPAPHFVLFNADPDPSTGQPWCPDCVRTVPSVRSTVASRGGSLLEVQVGARPAWKTPDHPFRTDPNLKLTGIPTLLRLDADGKEEGRLASELEDCNTAADAEALLKTFTSS